MGTVNTWQTGSSLTAICMIVLVNKKMKMKVCGCKTAMVSCFMLFSLCDKLMLSRGLEVKTNRLK